MTKRMLKSAVTVATPCGRTVQFQDLMLIPERLQGNFQSNDVMFDHVCSILSEKVLWSSTLQKSIVNVVWQFTSVFFFPSAEIPKTSEMNVIWHQSIPCKSYRRDKPHCACFVSVQCTTTEIGGCMHNN